MKTPILTLFLALGILPTLQSQPLSYGTCAACHGPDGKGLQPPGLPTPMAPALAGSKLVTVGDGEVAASIIFKGIAKADAKYMGMMGPLGPVMTDEQMAEVLTFVRSNFGNEAGAVTVEQVKAWRAKYQGQGMWSRPDLEKLIEAKKAADAAP